MELKGTRSRGHGCRALGSRQKEEGSGVESGKRREDENKEDRPNHTGTDGARNSEGAGFFDSQVL